MIRPAKAALPRLSGYAVSRHDRMMKNRENRKYRNATFTTFLKPAFRPAVKIRSAR